MCDWEDTFSFLKVLGESQTHPKKKCSEGSDRGPPRLGGEHRRRAYPGLPVLVLLLQVGADGLQGFLRPHGQGICGSNERREVFTCARPRLPRLGRGSRQSHGTGHHQAAPARPTPRSPETGPVPGAHPPGRGPQTAAGSARSAPRRPTVERVPGAQLTAAHTRAAPRGSVPVALTECRQPDGQQLSPCGSEGLCAN